MSRSYPALGVTLIGEPGDVQALADKLDGSASEIDSASFPAMKIVTDRLDGPTRQRAHAAVGAMVHGTVPEVIGSLKDSANTLRDWADEIESYREEFDRLEAEVAHMRAELAVKEPRLEYLRAHGDPEKDYAEVQQLFGDVGTLKRSIEAAVDHVQDKLDEYEDKADEVGNSLQSDSLSSPAASEGQRFTRELLGIASGLDKILEIGGYLTLFTGGLGTVAKQGVKEALDRIQDSIEKALIAGAGGKLAANIGATAGGAGVTPAELFLDGLSLPGIGPYARLKEDLLDRIESDATRLALGEAVDRVESELRGRAFDEPRPARP